MCDRVPRGSVVWHFDATVVMMNSRGFYSFVLSGYLCFICGCRIVFPNNNGMTVSPSKPPAPSWLKASDSVPCQGVVVIWEPITNATGYKVFRHTSSEAPADPFDTVNGDVTAWQDTSATPGIVYSYWVKTILDTGTSDYSPSDKGYRAGAVNIP